MTEKKFDAIIVGGGIAGLTSAAYLARDGQKVLLIEKNSELGGLVNSFKRNGFHFDAGVRALEDAGIILPMLKELGIQLDFVKSPVSVGVEDQIVNIESIESLYEYRDLLKKLYPDSEEEIEEVTKNIRKIMKNMDVLYGLENPVFKDLKNDRQFLFKELLPWLPKFLFTVRKINRMNMPIEGYLEKMVKNASLRDIISQHFFKNTPTFFAMSYFSLYLDYFYPKGGVGTMSEALKEKILEYNGEVLTATTIVDVQPEKNTVTDQNQVTYTFDNLVWAADLKTFYNIVDASKVSAKIRSKFDHVKSRMLESRGGDSVFTLFLQVDEPLETFKEIANGHFFYTPSKKGLGTTHTSELDILLENWKTISKEKKLEWLHRFTEFNTYEISIPGLKDSSLVPEGKTGVIISFLAEYDLFNNTLKDGWYDEFVQELEERVLKVISESVYPFLAEKVMEKFSFSPVSIKNRIGSSEGAITGWSFQKPVPVVNKIQISDRSVFTPFPSVFQAGQWAYSPAGVPMAILTGKLASDKVIKKRKKK